MSLWAAQPIMESMEQTTASANGWVSRASGLLKRGLWAVTGRKRRENRPLDQPDRRRSYRMKVRFEAKISDKSGWMRARGVNLHHEGALVMVSRPLAPQSVVFVHLKSHGLIGFARVRHCTERGLWRYAIGLEFPAPLMREAAGSWQFHQVRQTDGGGRAPGDGRGYLRGAP